MDEDYYDDEDYEPCPCGCEDEDPEYEALYDEDEEDEDDDYYDLSDEMVENASTSSPWIFTTPENINNVLSAETSSSGYSDDDPKKKYKSKLWAKLWSNVEPDRIDPAQSAADYYLLFGLVHNSFVEFEPLVVPSKEKFEKAGLILGKSAEDITKRHQEIFTKAEQDPRTALTKISKKADLLFHNLVEDLDKVFTEYVHLACGGELRHHPAMGPILGKSYRRGAWARWYYIYKDNGPESLLKMAELFHEFGGGSYGGPPWANAAEILYHRETGQLGPDAFTNKQLFVDRVFTLEHNGGCFLNKLNWVNHRKDREHPYNNHFAEMKEYVLNAHAANPVNIDLLIGYASKDIQELVGEYFQIAIDNDIDVVGVLNGKTTQKKVDEKIVVKPVKTKDPVESGIIDWSTEEDEVEEVTHVNPLIAELEKSLAAASDKSSDMKIFFPKEEKAHDKF